MADFPFYDLWGVAVGETVGEGAWPAPSPTVSPTATHWDARNYTEIARPQAIGAISKQAGKDGRRSRPLIGNRGDTSADWSIGISIAYFFRLRSGYGQASHF